MKKLFSKADDFDPGPTQLQVPAPRSGPALSTSNPPPEAAIHVQKPKLKEASVSQVFSTLEEEQQAPTTPQPIPSSEKDLQLQDVAAIGGALTKFKSLLNREMP